MNKTFDNLKPDKDLQKKLKQLCDKNPEIFLPELDKFKDFKLEIQFQKDSESKFCKPKDVPFAIQYDLSTAYDAGIKMDFRNQLSLIVMVFLWCQYVSQLNQDYSVTVNS